MKEFILENWKFLLEILLLIVSTLIVIFKRKVKIKVPESDLANMLSNIPVWIIDAENTFGAGHGEQKFSYVYNKAVNYLIEKLNCTVGCLPGALLLTIKDFIEEVLAAPTKKKEDTYEG